MSEFQITYTGSLRADSSLESAARRFADLYRLELDKAARLLQQNRPRILSRNLSRDRAAKVCEVLEEAGLELTVTPPLFPPSTIPETPTPLALLEEPAFTATEPHEQAPIGGPADEDVSPEVSDRPLVNVVGIASGFSWLGAGFAMVRQSLFAWVFASVVAVGLDVLLSGIPFVGGGLSLLVWPVLFAGLMLGAHRQSEGAGFPGLSFLAGMGEQPFQLILIGVIYGVCVAASTAVIGGISYGFSFLSGGSLDMATIAIVTLLTALPLTMILLFAPCLVAINGLSAVQACRLSVEGGLKNAFAFLIYLVASLIVLLIGALLFGVGILLTLPIALASSYAAYRDLFD